MPNIRSSHLLLSPIIKLYQMPDSEEVQPHEQDDCEDCQKERAENNELIHFYDRLGKIRDKVTRIRPNLASHGAVRQNSSLVAAQLGKKMQKPPTMELAGIDDKEMGFQLAFALLEREIKMKRENERLSRKIKEVEQANLELKRRNSIRAKQLESSYAPTPRNSFYSTPKALVKSSRLEKDSLVDSLDSAITQKQKKGFWGYDLPAKQAVESHKNRYRDSYSVMDNTHTNSSSISIFEDTGTTHFKAPDPEVSQYDKMNLWLFKLNGHEEEELFGRKGGNRKR